MVDEYLLQGNVQQILAFTKKIANCCDSVVAAVWAHSSVVGGSVFVTVSGNGNIIVHTQPGGTVLTASQYGTLTAV